MKKVAIVILMLSGWALYIPTRINVERVKAEGSSFADGQVQYDLKRAANDQGWLGMVYTLVDSLDVMNSQFGYSQMSGPEWLNRTNFDTVDELCDDVEKYAPDDYSNEASDIASKARVVVGQVKYANGIDPMLNRKICHEMGDIQKVLKDIYEKSAAASDQPIRNFGMVNTEVWMDVRSSHYDVLPESPDKPDY